MKITTALAVAMILATAAPVAQAQDRDANPSGPYVGLGYGQFNLRLKNLDDVGTAVGDITDSDDNAWKVFAGYRFSPYLSVEGAYIDFGNPGDNFQSTGDNGTYRLKLSGFAPSIVGTLPIGPVELFAKAGYYFYDVKTQVNFNEGPFLTAKDSRSDFLYGAGVGITFMEHLHARVEYERVDVKNAGDSNAIWLSGAWRF